MKTEAVKQLLLNVTHKDLAALYNHDMELQVNVAQGDGEHAQGEYNGIRWHGWTNGNETWKSFRIPYNASTQPHYEDRPANFNIGIHTEAVGMTGWNWKSKKSLWVAFDFDSLVGHKQGLSEQHLEEIREEALKVPYLTIRKSTGGNGLHFYVFFNKPPMTVNHTEHQALARAVLGQLAAETGYDFLNSVDICGGNMWVWHRKMTRQNGGLRLLKAGEPLGKIPINWRDHLKVVKNKRKKTIPPTIEKQSDLDKTFMELAGQIIREPLDEGHRKLFKYLEQIKAVWWWDQDNNMLVTHTVHLGQAHEELNLRGIFNTSSSHSSPHNCFCFPLKRGGWSVRRFSPGVQEHDSWDQDGSGWTRSHFNVDPNLATSSRNYGGIEHPSGGYVFQEAGEAQKAALALGADLGLPTWSQGRTTKMKAAKDGRLMVEVDKENTDNPEKMRGWIPEGKKWKRIFNNYLDTKLDNYDKNNYDDVIRHLTTEQSADAGWVVRVENTWTEEPLTHVKLALKSLGLSDKDTNYTLGGNIFRRWMIVNKPFQDEYPGNREWNRNACQLNYYPSKGDELNFPTWEQILNHVGEGLDTALLHFDWAKINGIKTGKDYLKLWIASIFQKPHEPLPFLFLFGPESSGKSIFHEALSLLITSGGYRDGKQALVSEGDFNGELKNAIICYVEETNLSKQNSRAYTRIKEWVTAQMLSIHPKNGTPYLIRNATHWIQCGNEMINCPVFTGDTRITMIHVGELKEPESKNDLFIKLKKEAPDFLGEIMKLEIPKSTDRLNIPVVTTSEKMFLQKQNQNALDDFIDECCHFAPGHMIKLSDFYTRFLKWLDVAETADWNIRKIGKTIKQPYIKGRSAKDNQVNIGNISFQKQDTTGKLLTVIGDKLVAKEVKC